MANANPTAPNPSPETTDSTEGAGPSGPGDINLMDRAAFGLALHEEMAKADPDEPMVDVINRAMNRVRAYLAARDTARGGKAAA